MEMKRAIELLIQEVEKIPYLKTLPSSNDEFRLWLKNVENIINTGLESEDKQKFWKASQFLRYLRMPDEDDLKQQDYIEEIIRYEIALKSIIQKYEILGIAGEGDNEGEVEKMDEKSIIKELEIFMEEIRSYYRYRKKMKQGAFTSKELDQVAELRQTLIRKSGKYKNIIAETTGKENIPIIVNSKEYITDIWSTGLFANPTVRTPIALEYCVSSVGQAIGKLEDDIDKGLRDEQGNLIIGNKAFISMEKPKAFIAHGGQSPILDKLKEFLIALGIEPLVVEEQPSEGRSVGENVDYYARQADIAIILATKGDIDGKTGGFIPRGNVLMEIGKLQEIFKERIIYLLQAGTKFPTNISEKVRGRFTTERMDDAFIKIARELCKFGILHAVKPPSEEQTS